jgi:hypothetical protein
MTSGQFESISMARLILTVKPTPQPPPPNDVCDNATIISSALTFPYSTTPVDMAQAIGRSVA